MQPPFLIGFHDKGRAGVIRAGKFVKYMGFRWVYVYNINQRLRFIDGFGVAPCILAAMEEHGIEEIHYIGKDCIWITTPETVRERGFAFMGKRGRPHSRGTYLHLPLKWWERREGKRSYPFLTGPMIWLRWMEPEELLGIEPVPEQIEMTL